MSSSRTLCLLAGALALTGCAQHYSAAAGEIDSADFGEANRQTYAAMVIDPDPQYDEPLATSAERAADAIARYREGQVKEPQSISSTASAGGSGS